MTNERASIGRFMRWIGVFWLVYTYVSLAVNSGIAFTNHPVWLHSTVGLWLVMTLIAYVLAYSIVSKALSARRDGEQRYWQRRRVIWRVAGWLLLLALNLVLMRFDATYSYMLWSAFGCVFSVLRLPWAFLLAVLPISILLASWGVLPLTNTPGAWLGFMGAVLAFVAYCGIMAMIYGLIHQRYERERLFHELQQTHEQLRQAHTQLADSAEHERELAVLRERGRLSREMHDTLGHALVLTTVKLEAVRRLMGVNAERADHEIVVTQDIVRQAMSELRATLAELRSPVTSDAPFTTTLARHAEEIGARAGMQVTCVIAPEALTWPESIQTTMLRVGTEAMNNVEQHAQAQHMTVHIAGEDAQAVMCISDDGVGLPALPTADCGGVTSPDGHFGLAGMRERVTALAGTIAITSPAERGTSVTARLPLAVTVTAPVGVPAAY